MYNRYIPQSDGSYLRSRIQEQKSEPKGRTDPPCQKSPSVPIVPQKPEPFQNETCRLNNRPHGSSVSGFLRQLLPKDFDTGDLLVILLLLLMAGDCEEEQNTALLTLALYLFM